MTMLSALTLSHPLEPPWAMERTVAGVNGVGPVTGHTHGWALSGAQWAARYGAGLRNAVMHCLMHEVDERPTLDDLVVEIRNHIPPAPGPALVARAAVLFNTPPAGRPGRPNPPLGGPPAPWRTEPEYNSPLQAAPIRFPMVVSRVDAHRRSWITNFC
jgi:hypothetical protein